MLALGLAIAAEPGIRSALDPALGDDRPSLVLAVLDAFGIVLPPMILALGAFAASLGVGVARRAVSALRSARDALAWAAILIGVIAFARLIQGSPWLVPHPNVLAGLLSGWLGLALAALGAASVRLAASRLASSGALPEETLVARERRADWNLLVPALLILPVVAARPLRQPPPTRSGRPITTRWNGRWPPNRWCCRWRWREPSFALAPPLRASADAARPGPTRTHTVSRGVPAWPSSRTGASLGHRRHGQRVWGRGQ